MCVLLVSLAHWSESAPKVFLTIHIVRQLGLVMMYTTHNTVGQLQELRMTGIHRSYVNKHQIANDLNLSGCSFGANRLRTGSLGLVATTAVNYYALYVFLAYDKPFHPCMVPVCILNNTVNERVNLSRCDVLKLGSVYIGWIPLQALAVFWEVILR